MSKWDENYNKLVSKELSIEGNKEWRFALEESIKKGTLQMNVREFKMTENYSGPTKNGFIIPLNSLEDITNFKKAFNDFCEEAEKIFL